MTRKTKRKENEWNKSQKHPMHQNRTDQLLGRERTAINLPLVIKNKRECKTAQKMPRFDYFWYKDQGPWGFGVQGQAR